MTERPRGIPTFEMKRPLRVHGMRVLLTIGFQEDRPELRAIAKLGVERGGQLDVATVQAALLPTLPKIVARRFLEGAVWCGLFSRVDRDRFAVTELGVRAQTEPVFVPQEGLWTIWVTDDPLVPPDRRVLRLEPCVRPRSERSEKASKIPAGLIDVLGSEAHAAWSRDLGRFRVAVDPQSAPSDCVTLESRARVTLALRVSGTGGVEVALDGVIEGDGGEDDDVSPVSASARFQHPALTPDEVWRTALGAGASEWDREQLAATFGELDDEARRTFRRSMRFSNWRHQDFGTFGPFDVAGVPLRPRAQADANAWGRWLLERRVDEYGFDAAWSRWTESVRQTLPEFSLALPSQLELARALHQGARGPQPTTYWHLIAPIDLEPAARSAT